MAENKHHTESSILIKSATNPTEMGGHIAITVKHDTSSPPLSTWVPQPFRSRFRSYHTTRKESLPMHSISRIMVFALALHNLLFMGGLTKIRTEMINENTSAFEINGNGWLMIISVVALFSVEVTSMILFFTNISSNYYANVKFLGVFSASVGPFLLLMVSSEHSSVSYLVSYVLYGVVIGYGCSGNDAADKDLDKRSPISIFTYFGLVMVPLVLLLVLFVPLSLDWIVYPVIYSIIGMEIVCFLSSTGSSQSCVCMKNRRDKTWKLIKGSIKTTTAVI